MGKAVEPIAAPILSAIIPVPFFVRCILALIKFPSYTLGVAVDKFSNVFFGTVAAEFHLGSTGVVAVTVKNGLSILINCDMVKLRMIGISQCISPADFCRVLGNEILCISFAFNENLGRKTSLLFNAPLCTVRCAISL